jgi:hypothetical protein
MVAVKKILNSEGRESDGKQKAAELRKAVHDGAEGRLFDGVGSGLSALSVMLAGITGNADGANDFAVHQERNTAFNRHCAFDAENAESSATSREGILEGLGGPLEASRAARFRNANIGAANLGVVHLLVVDEVAIGVYDGHSHIPIILASFGESRRSGLLGVL